MPSIINSTTTSPGGLISTGDSSNSLLIQTGDTTAITVDSSQKVTLANGLTVPTGSASTPAIAPTGDSNTGMFFPAADTIAFTEGGTESMRIDASGNVGIGINSPLYRLDVLASGATSATNSFSVARITGASSVANDLTLIGPNTSQVRIKFGDTDNSGIGEVGYNHSTNAMRFVTNDAERMVIASNGAIGIGGANYGTSGQVLTSGGSGAAPSWTTISSTPTTAQVLSATAGLTAGDVGTYVFARQVNNISYTELTLGGTRAGNGLNTAGVSDGGGIFSTTTLSGTWRLVGYSPSVSSPTVASMWVRIS